MGNQSIQDSSSHFPTCGVLAARLAEIGELQATLTGYTGTRLLAPLKGTYESFVLTFKVTTVGVEARKKHYPASLRADGTVQAC